MWTKKRTITAKQFMQEQWETRQKVGETRITELGAPNVDILSVKHSPFENLSHQLIVLADDGDREFTFWADETAVFDLYELVTPPTKQDQIDACIGKYSVVFGQKFASMVAYFAKAEIPAEDTANHEDWCEQDDWWFEQTEQAQDNFSEIVVEFLLTLRKIHAENK